MCPSSGPRRGAWAQLPCSGRAVHTASSLPSPGHCWERLPWQRRWGKFCRLSGLGFGRACALFLLSSKQLACDRWWRELFEDPTVTPALDLLRGIRVPRGDWSGWGEAGSFPRSSRFRDLPAPGAQGLGLVPGLHLVLGDREEKASRLFLTPPASLAGQGRAHGTCPLALSLRIPGRPPT